LGMFAAPALVRWATDMDSHFVLGALLFAVMAAGWYWNGDIKVSVSLVPQRKPRAVAADGAAKG
jgi:hypothetical protein